MIYFLYFLILTHQNYQKALKNINLIFFKQKNNLKTL
jgi:hypothetical protein